MRQKELEPELKKIGLSDKEARLYVASLELGQATAAEIAVHAGINRATAYAVIEDLKKEGMMSSFEKGAKTYFVAESPKRLKHIFERHQQKFREGLMSLEKVTPYLEKLYGTHGVHPHIRFFEGKGGVEAIREDILRTRTKTMEEVIPLDASYRFFPPRRGDHRERMNRALKHLHFRVIYASKKGEVLPKRKGLHQEARYVREQDFPITAEFVLYGNKAAMVTYERRLIGVIIEDEMIVQTLRAIFNLLWKKLG